MCALHPMQECEALHCIGIEKLKDAGHAGSFDLIVLRYAIFQGGCNIFWGPSLRRCCALRTTDPADDSPEKKNVSEAVSYVCRCCKSGRGSVKKRSAWPKRHWLECVPKLRKWYVSCC